MTKGSRVTEAGLVAETVVEEAAVEKKPPLQVLTLPTGAEILHAKCDAISKITPAIRELAHILEHYLKTHQHDDLRPIGIAAPQLGKTVRMFSCTLNAGGDIITLINPELVYEKKLHLITEACLSIPGQTFKLKRGKVVKLRGMLLDGSMRSFKGRGVIAQMFMHELNHLDGITIDTIGQRAG